jgi:DNA polymerase-3 subunit epsilon
LADDCEHPVLSNYLEQCAQMKTGDLADAPMIAVDLELTGLDAAANQIISVGWTLVDGGRIGLGSNRHVLVSAEQSVGSSAAIHELTDSEISDGVDLGTALEGLFDAAAGRVWVFHHAALDVSFLQKACTSWVSLVPPFVVLDTMQIELGLRKRRDIPVQQRDLQLGRLRADYHLPRYTAHNALIDALATAELLLAIAARLDRKNSLDLKPFLRFV